MKIRVEMNFRSVARALALATVSAGALIATQAMAQEAARRRTRLRRQKLRRTRRILVVGIRGSINSANEKKRNAKQIVNSVVSEDVGKLPDNNVPEALSRVTGVQIDRARGQGQSVTIRGLGEIQTTINGNQTNLGDGRSLNLADIPAELLKSVDVYKTRSADQVEGGIAGTVNIELRRPLDLNKGLTVAGSMRGSYDDIAEKISPYASLLLGERFETGIGEMGFLDQRLVDPDQLPGNLHRERVALADVLQGRGGELPNIRWPRCPRNIATSWSPIAPITASESGQVTRPSINAVFQWRANDNLDFVLEGGYIGSREKRAVNKLYSLNREEGAPPPSATSR